MKLTPMMEDRARATDCTCDELECKMKHEMLEEIDFLRKQSTTFKNALLELITEEVKEAIKGEKNAKK